jgi:GNAT superfamily N-acetyltransferase
MIQITPIRLSERARWGELWREYQRFYGIEIAATITESTWQRLHNGRIHGFAARTSADELVGIVHYLFHEDTWAKEPACYLQDLYVDPKMRGTGCGRLLIEAVAKAAKAAGSNTPYWLTHENNAVARQLYERLGKNHGFIQYTFVPPGDTSRIN